VCSDPAFHFNADPDLNLHFDVDWDPVFHFYADTNPAFILMPIWIGFLK
jgi:hypothetical protein